MKDLYEILGVRKEATSQEIKYAYRQKALTAHPDKGGTSEAMELLNNAYATLYNEESRTTFDEAWALFQEEDGEQTDLERLPTHGIPYSESYRQLHSALITQYKEKPLSINRGKKYFQPVKNQIYTFTQPFQSNEYFYDIYDYIDRHDIKNYLSNNKSPLEKIITPSSATQHFLSFLKGECIGRSLVDLVTYYHEQSIYYKNKNVGESNLYEAYFKLTGYAIKKYTQQSKLLSEEIQILTVSDLYSSLIKISDFVNAYRASLSEFFLLFQSKEFRSYFQKIIYMYWVQEKNDEFFVSYSKKYNGEEVSKRLLERLKQNLMEKQDQNTKNELKQLIRVIQLLNKFDADIFSKENVKTAEYVREKAFHALDWFPALLGQIGQAELINLFLQIGFLFQRAALLEKKPIIKMADEKLAIKMLLTSFAIGHYVSPDIEFYAYFHGVTILSTCQYADDNWIEMIQAFTHRTFQLADIFPFGRQHQSTIELFLHKHPSLSLMRRTLHMLVNIIENNKHAKKENPDAYQLDEIKIDYSYATVLYHAYEACLKDWYEDRFSPEVEENIRLLLMEQLLDDKGWSFKDIECNLNAPWVMIDRDQAGWITQRSALAHPKVPGNKSFKSVNGLIINHKTGEIEFTFTENPNARDLQGNLITLFDMLDMIELETQAGIFSLDPVDTDMFYHPFQQIRFSPPSLYFSPLFSSMLITDYLLKFFTSGQEVQGVYPFQMRSLNELLRNVPKYLTKIVDDYQQSATPSALHRFWIEAVEIPIAIDENNIEKNETTRIALGAVKMVVKKHKMGINADGSLSDEAEKDEGWPFYVISKQQHKKLIPFLQKQQDQTNHQTIFAKIVDINEVVERAIVLVDHSNQLFFYEAGTFSKSISLDDQTENLNRLFSRKRDGVGKIVYDHTTSAELYRLTKIFTRLDGRQTHFSPEYIFAQEFTKHYEAFAFYFPEFARLRELSRMAILIRFLANTRKMNIDHLKKVDNHLNDADYWQKRNNQVNEAIQEIRNDYETKYQTQVSTLQPDMRRQFSKWQEMMQKVHNYSDRNRLKNEMSKALLDAPLSLIEEGLELSTKDIKNVSEYIARQQFSHFKNDVDNETKKLQLIVPEEKNWVMRQRNQLQTLESRFAELKLGHFGKNLKAEDFKETCLWVPASFWHHPESARPRLVYGGVSVQPQVNVIPPGSAGHSAVLQSAFSGNQCTADRQRMLSAQGFQQHHIVSVLTNATNNHPLWRAANMDPNSRANLIYLPTNASLHETRTIHSGRHYASYSNHIEQRMDAIREAGLTDNWQHSQYNEALRTMLSEVRQDLRAGNIALNKNARPWAKPL